MIALYNGNAKIQTTEWVSEWVSEWVIEWTIFAYDKVSNISAASSWEL
jgi:hypothetical protein